MENLRDNGQRVRAARSRYSIIAQGNEKEKAPRKGVSREQEKDYPDFASRKSKNPNEIKVKEAEKAK